MNEWAAFFHTVPASLCAFESKKAGDERFSPDSCDNITLHGSTAQADAQLSDNNGGKKRSRSENYSAAVLIVPPLHVFRLLHR